MIQIDDPTTITVCATCMSPLSWCYSARNRSWFAVVRVDEDTMRIHRCRLNTAGSVHTTRHRAIDRVLGRGGHRPMTYTDADVELVATAIAAHHLVTGRTDADRNNPCVCGEWWDSADGPGWDGHIAEVATSALAAAGRLAAADGEEATAQSDASGPPAANDIELPGMWEAADFTGGQDETRESYAATGRASLSRTDTEETTP